MRRPIIAIISIFTFASTAMAGEISRTTPASDFTWRTTECPKPIQNRSGTISKELSLQRYTQDITAYLACLQREAQRDFEKAQMKMQMAIEKELDAETKKMDEMIKRAYYSTR